MTVRTGLYYNVAREQGIDPVVATTDATGVGFDLQGHTDATAVVLVGESGDTLSGSVYIELELQESDVLGSGYTAVADADLTNSVTGTNVGTFALIDAAAEDDAVYFTGYKGVKRFIRVVANLTGTHTNGTPLGSIIEAKAELQPAN